MDMTLRMLLSVWVMMPYMSAKVAMMVETLMMNMITVFVLRMAIMVMRIAIVKRD